MEITKVKVKVKGYKLSFKRDWPALVPVSFVVLFCLVMPYFGLYEKYLAPTGLHEWAGEYFQDFFRGLDKYSDNPLRDKVMYSYAVVLGMGLGVVMPFFPSSYKAEIPNMPKNFYPSLFAFTGLALVAVLVLLNIFGSEQTPSTGRFGIYRGVISYLWIVLFSTGLTFPLLDFICINIYMKTKGAY